MSKIAMGCLKTQTRPTMIMKRRKKPSEQCPLPPSLTASSPFSIYPLLFSTCRKLTSYLLKLAYLSHSSTITRSRTISQTHLSLNKRKETHSALPLHSACFGYSSLYYPQTKFQNQLTSLTAQTTKAISRKKVHIQFLTLSRPCS